MATSPKYFLSALFLIFIVSCSKSTSEDYDGMTNTERQKLSYKVFKEGEHLFQGSVKSMTRIERAISIDPTNCDAVRELSVAYLKRGMPNKWKTQMDKAVACNPKVWTGYRGYNYLWFYRDYKKAISDFNATDSLTPNFIDAPQGHSVDYWRGIAYLGLADYKMSIYFFDKHIKKETIDSGEDWVEQEAFLYRAIAHYESNDFVAALADIHKLLNYSRNLTADGKYYKALILSKQGKCKEAIFYINSAITDFDNGYYNSRGYVETLRQIYKEDLERLKVNLTACSQ